MALGDQSKALKIVSRAKGWNPDAIEDDTATLANFNRAPDPWKLGAQSVGRLPQEIPPNEGDFGEATERPLKRSVTWRRPKVRGAATSDAGIGSYKVEPDKAIDPNAPVPWNTPRRRGD